MEHAQDKERERQSESRNYERKLLNNTTEENSQSSYITNTKQAVFPFILHISQNKILISKQELHRQISTAMVQNQFSTIA